MPADAFTAGVKPGGLTSVTQIRILLCYLIKAAGPVSREIMQNALLEEQLVNYFEFSSGLEDIKNHQLVQGDDSAYTITEKGDTVAENLAYDLPRSVRESAIRAVLHMQTWARMAAENQAEILPAEHGYTVHCHIEEQGEEVFSLSLAMPDMLTAERVKNGFIRNGSAIYGLFVEKLTED